jgi:hypothetical protein
MIVDVVSYLGVQSDSIDVVFRNGHGFELSGYSEERCSEYQTPHAAKCFDRGNEREISR